MGKKKGKRTAPARAAFKSLYETKKYSDMTIKCRGREFQVHRAVLCTQSPVLAKMMDGEFKEAKTGVVDLSDDEPFILQKLFEFLYTGDYSDELAVDADFVSVSSAPEMASVGDLNVESSVPTFTPSPYSSSELTSSPSSEYTYEPLLINAKTYIIGDFYNILDLKELAKEKYEIALTKDWNTPSFSESLGEIFVNTQDSDRSIKEIALTTVREHLQELLDRGEFASLLEQNGKIALEILKHGTAHKTPAWQCSACIKNEYGIDIICDTCGV